MAKQVIRLVIVLTLFCCNSSGNASQLVFNTETKKGEMLFNYQWQGLQQQIQQLSFSLPLQEVNRKHHKKFVANSANQYVYIELYKAARKINPKDARVNIYRQGQDIEVQVTSRSPEQLEKWQRTIQRSQAQAYQQYLDDNYLSYLQTHVGQQFIKPDHLRYIEEGKASLSPAAQALNKKISATNNTQSFVNLLLSWVQSIPYNTLQDRQTTNGAGYLPPSLVLSNNQGDCDSKSVLAASLIRSVLPEVKMVMLYLPKHALLGININNNRRGRRLDIEGINYTLMEPTGPAELKLGNIARSSEQAIASKKYSYEIIP